MKVVFDADVIVHCVGRTDQPSLEALAHAQRSRSTFVVCERLLKQYRGAAAKQSAQWYPIVDNWVMAYFGSNQLERRPDPVERIRFGPAEDRFHLQLAIDAGAAFHVSKDRDVLAVSEQLRPHGVHGCNPSGYLAATSS